jgi:hypothetical protein
MGLALQSAASLCSLWSAPDNYLIDRVSGAPSVIARSPCDEAIQGHSMRGASSESRLRPLDCFASLAMTGR